MMIWSIRNEGIAPQHIGNCDGMSKLEDLIANGRKAGHSIAAAAYAVKGNDARCYTFTTMEAFEFFTNRNPDIRYTESAFA